MLSRVLMRLVLQPYWSLTRSQTLGVQGVVVRNGVEVLLVRHGYVGGWHLPGGGVERNESFESALRRELREETGLEIRGRPKLHGIFANFKRYKGDHIAVYVVPDWERPRIPVRSLEIVEQKFFDLRSLPNGLIEGAKRRLDEIFNQRPRSDEW
jgi:ADP-ribose pyrophosphatase YjhB (NUDIX family)